MTAWGLTPEGTQPRSAEEGGQQLPEPERLPTRPVSTRAGCRPALVSSLWRTCLRPDFSAVWAHDTARWAGKGGGRRGHRHRAQSWGQGAPHGEQALFSESQAQHQVVLVGLRGSLSPSSRDTARPRPGHHISVLSGKVNLIHNSSVSAGGRGWAPVTSREPPAVLTPPASLLYRSVLKVNCPETQKRRQLGQKSQDTELGGKLAGDTPSLCLDTRNVWEDKPPFNKTRVIRTLHVPGWS